MAHSSTQGVTNVAPEMAVDLTKSPPSNFDEMANAMLHCEQTVGQSVYQHGRSVCEHLAQLIDYLKGNCELTDWRLPSWLESHKDEILVNLHDEETLQLYTLFHDCGKPFCIHIDQETGRSHFPNHADVSRYIWCHVGGSEVVGRLIANDMLIHTGTSDEISRKLGTELSVKDSVSILLTSLAEIHSNAKMFGSIEAINFKMKLKTVERRGRQIVKFWFNSSE